jgi:CspA family cold shock protein
MGCMRVEKGKVVRFDEFRGYGFVAPDAGGEDVFIHVNDLDFDKRLIEPGALVEFDVEDGDRGPKASR